ncbi:MAG: hypothetical protein ABGZ35_05755 [Planctomycetaceae bacterium]|jgi:hypothetical protein
MQHVKFRSVAILLTGLIVPPLWGGGLFVEEASLDPARVGRVDLSMVIGGAGCYVDGLVNCPINDFSCHQTCANKQPGDACAADGYAQQNPSYRKPRPGAGGKKSTVDINPAKLCGYVHGCGPQCIASIRGIGCPFGTVADYEVEKKPAGESCDAG